MNESPSVEPGNVLMVELLGKHFSHAATIRKFVFGRPRELHGAVLTDNLKLHAKLRCI